MSLCLRGLSGNVLIMLQRSCIWLTKSSHKMLQEYIVTVILYGCLLMFLCRQQLLATVRHKITAGHGDLI